MMTAAATAATTVVVAVIVHCRRRSRRRPLLRLVNRALTIFSFRIDSFKLHSRINYYTEICSALFYSQLPVICRLLIFLNYSYVFSFFFVQFLIYIIIIIIYNRLDSI